MAVVGLPRFSGTDDLPCGPTFSIYIYIYVYIYIYDYLPCFPGENADGRILEASAGSLFRLELAAQGLVPGDPESGNLSPRPTGTRAKAQAKPTQKQEDQTRTGDPNKTETKIKPKKQIPGLGLQTQTKNKLQTQFLSQLGLGNIQQLILGCVHVRWPAQGRKFNRA